MLSLLQSDRQHGIESYGQIPLIHIIDEDDRILLNSPDAEWFRILYYFPWKEYRETGAEYYDALYQFNITGAEKRQEMFIEKEDKAVETKEEAVERLLFSRTTMQDSKVEEVAIIYKGKVVEHKAPKVNPETIAPGIVPERLGGKKPKCFFAMFKSFLGATLMGFSPEPEVVHSLLWGNPSFIRVCGFAPKVERDEYCYRHVPGLRKMEQFDQIMRESGLWSKIKLAEVRRNIEEEIIKKENELVGDTTHYYAYSGFETVTYKDENGKEQRKSQSKVTKNCRCKDRDNCSHQWELTDDGAGTIVKSNHKMYWGHKAGVLGLPRQGVPLDVVAAADAATFDGETLYPHVERLFENLPEIKPWIDRVLYDSACDNKDLKEKFQEDFGIELKASLNPRRKKDVTRDLPRAIEKITPYGVPICTAGYEMEYKGMRYEKEKFIYQSPVNDDKTPVCLTCNHKTDCCPNSVTGRTINISFDLLPHINPDDPPMAKRFKAIMSRRPSVERMIKRLKCDLGDDRLSKRGNASFQAYLDKTMIAFHILLRH
ncbi:MAG TPA: hypothetical protein ENG83_09200 [Nitrospirae bacterium]|nr:hypothetical protein [Nitrospirota bacterium]